MVQKRPITSEEHSPEAVRAALRPLRNSFAVALMSPGNAFAIGAVIRVAHNFLAREVIVVGPDDWYAKGAMGMEKYESVVRVADAPALAAHVSGRPMWVIEKDYARRSIVGVKEFPEDVVFVFGSERFGVPEEVVDRADEVLAIPIYGVNHSLPVAVAAGIVMHEWARRRYREGAVV
jgi:tRNA G18 (ribose-2'-O)-methylase SpoU